MGEIFNGLPNKDELEDYIRTYAGDGNVTSGEYPASLEYLMRFWERAKGEYLFKLLGNQYIIEKDYTFTRNVNDIRDSMRQACRYGAMETFYDEFTKYVEKRYQKQMEGRPNGDDEIPWREYKALMCLIEYVNLARNEVNLHTTLYKAVKVPLGNEKLEVVTIQSGAKPVRLLAKFAEAWDIEGFESFRLEHSRILNDKELVGKMCLSIHPLDYITMSDNPYDWESCMNWMNDGQFRMGTVEMMNSKYVVVAYIKGDRPLRFYDKFWNGKKWRNLFIVDRDFITAVKGYPYQSTDMDIFCLKWLRQLAAKNLDWHYDENVIEYEPDSYDDRIYIEDEDEYLAFTFETGVMYNDFGNNNTTHIILRNDMRKDGIYCYYSGKTECMYCGRELDSQQDCNDDLDDSGCVICNECCKTYHCDGCGEGYHDRDDLYELDGNVYCESCYNDHAVEDIYGEIHDRDNCTVVRMLNRYLEKNEIINDDDARSIWVESLNDIDQYLKNSVIYHSYKRDSWWWSNGFYYFTQNDLNEDGEKFFLNGGYVFSDPDKCRYPVW